MFYFFSAFFVPCKNRKGLEKSFVVFCEGDVFLFFRLPDNSPDIVLGH